MDALKIDKAHVVGHSMGAATALHVGIHYPKRCISVTAAGCGYGSSADPKVVEASRAASRETGKMFAENTDGGGRQALRRRPDPAGAEKQGPARLRPFHQDAERAFRARPFAHDAQPAGQAADAVGDGSRPEEIFAAAAHHRRRRGRLVRRRQHLSCAARCRPRGCWWSRAPATPSPARSRTSSTPRSTSFSAAAEAGRWLAHNRQTQKSSGSNRWTSSSKARPRW